MATHGVGERKLQEKSSGDRTLVDLVEAKI